MKEKFGVHSSGSPAGHFDLSQGTGQHHKFDNEAPTANSQPRDPPHIICMSGPQAGGNGNGLI